MSATILYQQLMSGSIDWKSSATANNTSRSGPFDPPSNWKELSNAFFDLLTPSNSLEECALRLASSKMEKDETVSNYALRFTSLVTRFERSVERTTPGRTPWAAMSVVLWQNGLTPAI